MENRKAKQAAGLIICTIVVGCISSILVFINPLEKIQQQLSSYLYVERKTSNKIYVVAIENNTINFQDWGRPAEWCRTYYIPVLEKLLSYQPRVIGFDIMFSKQSKGICKDELNELISSGQLEKIREYSPTEMADHPTDSKLANILKKTDNLVMINVVNTNINKRVASVDDLEVDGQISWPWRTFVESGVTFGHNRLLSDLNSKIKYLFPIYTNRGEAVPAFSLQVVSKYLNLGKLISYNLQSERLQLNYENGGLALPLENYWMLINFSKKPNPKIEESFQDNSVVLIPFYQLYTGKIDPKINLEDIRDKIVLIGMAREFDDSFPTPMSSTTQMPGVMIHAQAIQTILDGAWLYNQSFAAQAVTIAALALISMLLIFGLRINWALPALGLLLLIYCVPYAQLMFRQWGIIVNLVYPPLTIILAAIVGYAYRYLTEFKMKNRVTSALGQFVNTQVAENVLNSSQTKVEKIGEKRDISVIFTDIKGFTTISEQLKAESVVALLNEYFEVMAEVIVRNGGLVDKYEGDAIMAFFEAKEGLPSHQLRAAQTALEMRAALPRLLEKWHNDPLLPGGEKKPEIDFRVGISSGEAIVGTIGSSEHIQYTAIGDIVNLGSRLESANKKYESHILLAEATFEAISNSFVCRYVDNIKVKGKDKPVKIYQLLGRKEDISAEQEELLVAYNQGIELYFQRKFSEAAEHFENRILKKWPNDFLAMIYAGRARKCMLIPPAPDWDFVYKMETK